MAKITTNAQDVLKRFDAMLDLTQNFKPYFKKIVGESGGDIEWTIRGGLKTTLESQKGPRGESWPPLSEKYKAWKDRKFPGKRILELTGALYDSLVKTNQYSVFIMQNKSLYYGTSAPYAAAMHFGHPKWKEPKPRPYMGWRPGQEDYLKLLLRAYLKEAYKQKSVGV